MRKLKYLLAHIGWSERAIEWHKALAEEYKKAGYHVDTHCLISDNPAPRYSYQKLDALWQKRNKDVVKIYEQLKEVATGYDVLINFNGANIHPEWLKDLNTFNVYVCFDDPESSHILSEHTAKYFDFSFTGNAACIQLYQSWGIKNCDFLPLGCHPWEYDHQMSVDRIINKERSNDLVFLGERTSPWRQNRLDKVQKAFPEAILRGKGWQKGFLPDDKKIPTLVDTKIGLNIHNSVGPVNLRTYSLPANGVMQVADNKHRLGSLFKLNEEVVGYDTIEEGIELINYYIAHDNKRKELAAAGYEKVMRSFTPDKQWQHLVNTVEPHFLRWKEGILNTPSFVSATEKEIDVKKLVKATINKLGIDVKKINKTGDTEDFTPESVTYRDGFQPYFENPEAGAINFEDKIERERKGGFFEWPNITALNLAIVSLLGDAKKIVELGCGTGVFAYEAANDPSKHITAADLNTRAVEWAKKNRQKENITYENRMIGKEDGPFDMAVSVEVIEHLSDYVSFIKLLQSLAPKAILTTPNKSRQNGIQTGPPSYFQHTREWTAGEFYWVLKSFYKDVKLYSMENEYIPALTPIMINEKKTPLVALCEKPLT